jgi:hypothetical protein
VHKIHEKPLDEREIRKLEQAEKLAAKFLQWDIDPKTQDVMEILRNMVEECGGLDDDDEMDLEDEAESGEASASVEMVATDVEESKIGHATASEKADEGMEVEESDEEVIELSRRSGESLESVGSMRSGRSGPG